MNRKLSMFPSMMLRAAGHSGTSNVRSWRRNIFGIVGLMLWIWIGDNTPNGAFANAEHFTDFPRSESVTVKQSHLACCFPRYNAGVSSFNAGISRIVLYSSKPQMVGPNTQVDVTCMQHPLTFWDGA